MIITIIKTILYKILTTLTRQLFHFSRVSINFLSCSRFFNEILASFLARLSLKITLILVSSNSFFFIFSKNSTETFTTTFSYLFPIGSIPSNRLSQIHISPRIRRNSLHNSRQFSNTLSAYPMPSFLRYQSPLCWPGPLPPPSRAVLLALRLLA